MNEEYILYKHMWIKQHPPHLSQYEDIFKCKNILKHGGCLLRNVYDFDIPTDSSFWFVIKDSFGGMEELSTKVRNQIRKSLKTYDIKRVLSEEILKVGYPIIQSAINGYRIKAPALNWSDFETSIKSRAITGNTDFWCVYEKETNKAVALAINTRCDEYCEYNALKADPAYLKNSTYPYYGLLYEMNKYYLEELHLKYVSDGARSITEHSNIQPFLIEKFHFRKAYCKLQIEYQWWVKIAITLLYPFRRWIKYSPVRAIMNMEAMRRNEY